MRRFSRLLPALPLGSRYCLFANTQRNVSTTDDNDDKRYNELLVQCALKHIVLDMDHSARIFEDQLDRYKGCLTLKVVQSIREQIELCQNSQADYFTSVIIKNRLKWMDTLAAENTAENTGLISTPLKSGNG